MVTAYHHQATLGEEIIAPFTVVCYSCNKTFHWNWWLWNLMGASFSHFKYCLEFLQTKRI